MAPKASGKRSPPPDPDGIFSGMVVFLIDYGVQSRRLQIWKQKLVQMGAIIEGSISKNLTHIFAMNLNSLLEQFSRQRLEIFNGVYPKEIYPFGLIAWTGNDVLNRRLRILAESKGFRLDDTGLFPATQGSGGKRVSATTSLKFDTEKEVFDFLGYPWLEPHERNL